MCQHYMNKGCHRSVIDTANETIKLVEDREGEQPIWVKEIEKLYRKHHRLMGYEKKTKVVQSLMRKGFSYDDISTVYERICEELEDE